MLGKSDFSYSALSTSLPIYCLADNRGSVVRLILDYQLLFVFGSYGGGPPARSDHGEN